MKPPRNAPAWIVRPDEAATRLDKYLAASDRLGSRRNASIALERGRVFVNGRAVTLADAKRQLHSGDRVVVWTDRPGSASKPSRAKAQGDLWILYEDDALLVVNKPPGLLSVPLERKADADSAYDTVERHLRPQGKRRPLIVHRIDRDTSGLVVFAKDARTQHVLKGQFRRHEAERVYLAVVYGAPDPATGTWRDRLVWDQRALIQKETHPDDPTGADAISRYHTVERFAETSLIEVRLETGKRNQIRLQARLRGHTLIGETRYVYGPDDLRPVIFPRQALHAWRLTLHHPADGRVLRFEAPMPADFEDLLNRLRTTKPRS